MKSVAIIYGWAGGPQLMKRFTGALEDAGFQVIKDPTRADIIFAHSAGCYKVPKHNRASLIVLHGPPYWPGKSIISRLFKHKSSDIRTIAGRYGVLFVLKRFVWETIYVLIYPDMTITGIKHNQRLDFLADLKSKRVLLIRNKDDNLCTPDIRNAGGNYKNIKFAEVAGGHDDYLTNPKPYIDLLLKDI